MGNQCAYLDQVENTISSIYSKHKWLICLELIDYVDEANSWMVQVDANAC